MRQKTQVNENTEEINRKSETASGVGRWLRREVMGIVLVGLTLFLPAWRLDWVWGWALVGIYAVWVSANALILIPRSPELLVERARSARSSKPWDMVIMGIFGLSTIAKYILAGLDFHNGWTAPLPLPAHLVALVVTVLGFAIVTWSMTANAFFSTTYRLQEDRGHTVATVGPYRTVRHPGYVGTIACELATPIMLGSLWALILGGLGALLIVVRTALEDRTLQAELPGYAEYSQRTRHRLLPGIW